MLVLDMAALFAASLAGLAASLAASLAGLAASLAASLDTLFAASFVASLASSNTLRATAPDGSW
jgi:hypothetical protein